MLKDYKRGRMKIAGAEATRLMAEFQGYIELAPGLVEVLSPQIKVYSLDERGELGDWLVTVNHEFPENPAPNVREQAKLQLRSYANDAEESERRDAEEPRSSTLRQLANKL